MDLLLNNADKFIKEVETRGTLSCSDHALVEFVISRNTGSTQKVELRKTNFRRMNFWLL